MHVQLLADLPWTPSKSSEHEGRVAAFDLHHLCVGVVQRSFLRKPNAHTVLQRCKLFARGFQWGPEATRLRSRLRMRGAYREMPTYNTARAFARGLPLFSEKQTAVTMNAYLALQRVMT